MAITNLNYIDLDRVKACLPTSYNGVDDQAVLTPLLASSSAFLDKFCNRPNGGFLTQTYDELYHGTGETILFLNNYPVQSVNRIGTTKLPCLSIHNTDPDMGARATFQVNGTPSNPFNYATQNVSTGMTFTYVKNAVTTSNTLLWTDYPTVNALAAAINGLGDYWQATVMGGFGTWSTADIRATQGAFGARITTAYVWLWWWELPQYDYNQDTGEVNSWFGFARGQFNWRVIYTAGYTVFPDDLAQALAELTANAYMMRNLNSNAQGESIGGYSYSKFVQKGFDGLSLIARNTINRYKLRTVSKFSEW